MLVGGILVVWDIDLKVFSKRAVGYNDKGGPTNSDRECVVDLAVALSRAYVC